MATTPIRGTIVTFQVHNARHCDSNSTDGALEDCEVLAGYCVAYASKAGARDVANLQSVSAAVGDLLVALTAPERAFTWSSLDKRSDSGNLKLSIDGPSQTKRAALRRNLQQRSGAQFDGSREGLFYSFFVPQRHQNSQSPRGRSSIYARLPATQGKSRITRQRRLCCDDLSRSSAMSPLLG